MKLRELLMIATGVTLLARGLRSAGAVCYLRRAHDPRRQFIGGFRCSVCGRAGDSLDDFAGHLGEGYVPPTRRVYDPAHGDITRTSAYEKTSRGVH